jgi:hypothetical protein
MSCFRGGLKNVRKGWDSLCPPCCGTITVMEPVTTISIPPETLELLEATALANQCTPEEIIRAAIEAFLDCDKEPEAGSFES